MCARAVLRWPGVSRSLGDEPDGSVVQIAADDDEPVLRGVRKDVAKLVLSLLVADVGNRTQVSGVHANP